MTHWDEFFEKNASDKLAKYLIRTCVLRTLQLVDNQDSQAMLLLQHFQSLDLDEATYLVSFLHFLDFHDLNTESKVS